MANVPGEVERLLKAGRQKILRVCLIWGIPLLAILVFAGLQYADVVHLEEYFVAPPDKADPRVVWQALAALAAAQFLCVALGVLQGWAGIRQAKRLRRRSTPGKSEGTCGEAR
jgi:hypothetical protein